MSSVETFRLVLRSLSQEGLRVPPYEQTWEGLEDVIWNPVDAWASGKVLFGAQREEKDDLLAMLVAPESQTLVFSGPTGAGKSLTFAALADFTNTRSKLNATAVLLDCKDIARALATVKRTLELLPSTGDERAANRRALVDRFVGAQFFKLLATEIEKAVSIQIQMEAKVPAQKARLEVVRALAEKASQAALALQEDGDYLLRQTAPVREVNGVEEQLKDHKDSRELAAKGGAKAQTRGPGFLAAIGLAGSTRKNWSESAKALKQVPIKEILYSIYAPLDIIQQLLREVQDYRLTGGETWLLYLYLDDFSAIEADDRQDLAEFLDHATPQDVRLRISAYTWDSAIRKIKNRTQSLPIEVGFFPEDIGTEHDRRLYAAAHLKAIIENRLTTYRAGPLEKYFSFETAPGSPALVGASSPVVPRDQQVFLTGLVHLAGGSVRNIAQILSAAGRPPLDFGSVANSAKAYWNNFLTDKLARLAAFGMQEPASEYVDGFVEALLDHITTRVGAIDAQPDRAFLFVRGEALLKLLEPFVNCGAVIPWRKVSPTIYAMVPSAGLILALTNKLVIPSDEVMSAADARAEASEFDLWARKNSVA